MPKSHILYFIKDRLRNLYWKGLWGYEDHHNWGSDPYCARTPHRLLESLTYPIPKAWQQAYALNHPTPSPESYGQYMDWRGAMRMAWDEHRKTARLSALDTLKAVVSDQNLVLYSVVQGCALDTATPLT